jgi:excisionase family DNA binding protein
MSGVFSSVGLAVRTSHEQIDVMNAQALATHLGVTERTVRRWIERGVLPAEKRGRSFVISREDGERLKLGTLGTRVADDRSQLEELAAERDRQLAELRGRYRELQARVAHVERELNAERRRSIRLELELEGARRETTARRAA